MKCANATKLHRKSGGAQRSGGICSFIFVTANVRWVNLLRAQFLYERKLQVPRLPPDFLSALVVSVNLMRLSSEKAAYVVVFESSVVGNPEFARDDKV
jgi:hypothetical protein